MSDDYGNRHYFYQELWTYVDPLPNPREVVRGIEHKNLLNPEPILQ